MAMKNRARRRTAPRTHEGATAKRIGAEALLRRSVLACLLWERTFYEDGESIADRIRATVAEVSLDTAAAVAIEAREEQHLRHVPLLIVREMARRGGRIVGDTLTRVVQRADELTEFLAIYWDGPEGEPLSAQVKRGLAEAFPKFDAYQLAKYDRTGKAVRLRDVLALAHPKPRDAEQAALWKQLADGTLPAPDTWEVALSGGGDPKREWTRLLAENRLGGLALLRNLRNMLAADVDEQLIRKAIDGHSFARVLPFRFIAAAEHAPILEDSLESAMLRATESLEKLPGRTALLLDNSGSMEWHTISGRGALNRVKAAGGLAVLIREVCEQAVVIGFGSDAAVLPPRRGFALMDAYERGPGGGTFTERAKQLADEQGYDRVIVLTDEQSHEALSDPADGARGYVVNVAADEHGIGYGRWTHIDGWSENVVRYIVESEARVAG